MFALLIGYLLLASLAGFALTFVSRMPWQLEGRIAAGVVLGFSAAAMLTWLIAIPMGMGPLPVGLGAVALLLMLAACVRFLDWRPALRDEAVAAGHRWRRLQSLPLALVLIPAVAFFVPFYSRALEMRPDGLYAGYVNIWGDWCTHLSMSGYLSHTRDLLPPQNPFFTGVKLTYPFLPDFFSGMLLHLGMDLQGALPLSSAILSIALVVVFYTTAVRFLGSGWAAAIAVLVFFLGGGLGFLRLIGEVHPAAAGVLPWLNAAADLALHPLHEYTLDREQGFQWLNPILAYLIPQRTTLFGFSLGLVTLSLLWFGRSVRSLREVLLAGILLGLMPLFHASTYFDLVLLLGVLMLLDLVRLRRGWSRAAFVGFARQWAVFFVPALLLGMPQVLLILPPAGYRPTFLRIELGWLSGWSPALPQFIADYVSPPTTTYDLAPLGLHNLVPLSFWILNTALLIPLAAVTLYGRNWGKPGLRRFLAPIWILFLVPNLVILQPWDWDNTKWFLWWAIPASMLAGLALYQLFRRGALLATVGVVLLLVTTLSGLIDVNRARQTTSPNVSYRLLTNDELAVAAWARSSTPGEAIFLTGWKNDHPILTESGRPEVMGYPGWLWTWGLPAPDQRQDDVIAMFRGGPRSEQLMKDYRVDYVVIGTQELGREIGANMTYFSRRYTQVYASPGGDYHVFRVT
ncbi:MAG: hypothetical protein QOE92_184 [Chloroflexota bacterium]|jgi:hypothetical protein|nr:hypothetical protein [Chloroflexota bacterium]